MKVDFKLTNTPSFGLSIKTHELVTRKSMANFNDFSNKELDLFGDYVQRPDYDETGLKIFGKETCNNHFFYPRQIFHPSLSHLDFDGKHNAFSRYAYHIASMFSELKDGYSDSVIEHAARAKHFLDDMSVGLHIERGTFLKKYFDLKMHQSYENYILNNQDDFIANYSKSKLPKNNKSFIDLFINTVNISLENEFPNLKNVVRWNSISQNTINLNIDSSNEFFRLFRVLVKSKNKLL